MVFCPKCGAEGKSVKTITVKNLVRDHMRVLADTHYSFCRTQDCDLVYFSATQVFARADLKVRVGIKEQEAPIPLCYCFGYDREDLRRDIDGHGVSGIPDRIKAEVKGGFCACEVKNPSGGCCLGNVNRVIMDLKKLVVGTTK
jgi:hypothetical protein